jgi:nitrogen permease regulator 2-like protein
MPLALCRAANLLTYNCSVLQVIPHIDGVKYAKKISLDAEVDIEIVKRCVRALLYYNCVALIDIFQYSNVYTATDKVSIVYTRLYTNMFILI